MFNKTRAALILSATVALTASTGMVAVAQDDEMAEGGLICVIVPPVENPFFGAMQQIAADKAEELGYSTDRLVHNDDANEQLQLIESCVAQGAVAIILDNAGADATVAPLQAAADAGVPSFLVDREITSDGVAVAQIVSDNFQGATILAEEFAELMGEEGTYIELTGKDTDTNAHVRSDGYHGVLDELDMEMVAQQTANWSQDEGFTVAEALLQQNPDVKGIIAGNDTMALGAQAAILAAGLDDIIVVGFDGSDDAIISINAGELKATALQPVADMALQAAIQADEYIKAGGTTEMDEKQSIGMVLLTSENACDYFQFAPTAEAGTSPNCE